MSVRVNLGLARASVYYCHFKTLPVYYDESMTSEHAKFAAYKTAGGTLATFAKSRVWSHGPDLS